MRRPLSLSDDLKTHIAVADQKLVDLEQSISEVKARAGEIDHKQDQQFLWLMGLAFTGFISFIGWVMLLLAALVPGIFPHHS